jgi:hypothetical protein
MTHPLFLFILGLTVAIIVALTVQHHFKVNRWKYQYLQLQAKTQVLNDAVVLTTKLPKSQPAKMEVSSPLTHLVGHDPLPEEFLRKHMSTLAKKHPSQLVRQLATELDKKRQSALRNRTTHYLHLRKFVLAASPETIGAYDELNAGHKQSLRT